MAVLSVNGNDLRPDTSVGELNKIFEEIVGLHSVDFEFESTGSSTGPHASVGSVHDTQSVSPEGWCAKAQSRVLAAGLGKREAMIVVLWNSGGTACTAASSMCEHAAHQLADVLSNCFTSGLVRDVACVAAGTQASETSDGEDAAALHMWSRSADGLLRRLVPEHKVQLVAGLRGRRSPQNSQGGQKQHQIRSCTVGVDARGGSRRSTQDYINGHRYVRLSSQYGGATVQAV